MKRILSLLASVCLLAAATACGDDDHDNYKSMLDGTFWKVTDYKLNEDECKLYGVILAGDWTESGDYERVTTYGRGGHPVGDIARINIYEEGVSHQYEPTEYFTRVYFNDTLYYPGPWTVDEKASSPTVMFLRWGSSKETQDRYLQFEYVGKVSVGDKIK